MLRIFEAIKKSPFLNRNFLLSSLPANASAENGKFKMKDERGKMKDEREGIYLIIKQALRLRHATEDDLSSDEWHLYPQNIPLEIPFLALSGSVE